MIKIKVVVILMVAIMGITAVPIQASEKQGDSKKQENKATQVISDEEQELLKKEDIQVVSDENGNINGLIGLDVLLELGVSIDLKNLKLKL